MTSPMQKAQQVLLLFILTSWFFPLRLSFFPFFAFSFLFLSLLTPRPLLVSSARDIHESDAVHHQFFHLQGQPLFNIHVLFFFVIGL